MRVRVRETGQVMFLEEFLRSFTTTHFTDPITEALINELGADVVLEGPQPTMTADQYAVYVGVELNADGNWQTVYEARDYTPEQIAQRLADWRASTSCSPFQGRMALIDADLLASAEAAVNAADQKTKTAWEYALVWERTSPMIVALATALGLTDVEVDDLFKAALQITA